MTQIYSPSSQETLTIFNDDDPPIAEQIAWITSHPDLVRLNLPPATEAISSRAECIKALQERRI